MKKIEIYLPEHLSDSITITAIGHDDKYACMAVGAFNISGSENVIVFVNKMSGQGKTYEDAVKSVIDRL